MGPSDASVVVVLVIGSDSAMPLVLALRTPMPVLQTLVLLASGAAQPRPPSSCSWAEVVGHSSLRAMVLPRPSPRCCEDASSDSVFLAWFSLMRMELLQLFDICVEEASRLLCEEASRLLCEEVANLKLLLACIGDSLESLEACPRGGLSSFPHRLHFRLTPLT
jgi:hypothetical protein